MKLSWTQGLEPDIAKEIKEAFKSSSLVRKRLKVLIEDKIESTHKNSLSKEGYEISNWSLKQADNVGYERALRDIISLIE
mgnify:CR=1 FL=1